MKRCPEFPDKKRFSTKREAETTILLISNSALDLYVYYCEACKGWHLSSKNYGADNF